MIQNRIPVTVYINPIQNRLYNLSTYNELDAENARLEPDLQLFALNKYLPSDKKTAAML